ncbi:nucleoside 2-deoxyribosyltransferase [Caballeronia sordidicola]|uniref:Nucleoside 2-deoxyribosyltransferase n=1 Tax=Caballeronia sordidicola TaxID=196367 RepID=A0A242MP90_CABSO|nr:nucleoside 2-deoxyribosyltransferase [Caballeronia sordidicola]OTP73139.1 Nucleoside 2-deoxyribosyltransferase [Caballeronia sordidicola]
MRGPTKKQLLLIELVDQGLSVEEIATRTGKLVTSVHKQLGRVRRKVREGRYTPTPLPIELAASTPRIYLAGFDVFRNDALAHGETLKAMCQSRGAIGLYPLDGEVPDELDQLGQAQWICRANMELIRSADIVMANLNDFRGAGEPDSGTAFEVGFAAALNKPIWAYTGDNRTLIERVSVRKEGGASYCASGFVVEDFGLSLNLMLACTARVVVGGPENCLDSMAAEGLI